MYFEEKNNSIFKYYIMELDIFSGMKFKEYYSK